LIGLPDGQAGDFIWAGEFQANLHRRGEELIDGFVVGPTGWWHSKSCCRHAKSAMGEVGVIERGATAARISPEGRLVAVEVVESPMRMFASVLAVACTD